MNTIGENVKKYRKKCGMTPRRLAELVDVDTVVIRDIESGKMIPCPELVQDLATAMRESAYRLYSLPELRTPQTFMARVEPAADGEIVTIRFAGKRTLDMIQMHDDGMTITLKEVREECED